MYSAPFTYPCPALWGSHSGGRGLKRQKVRKEKAKGQSGRGSNSTRSRRTPPAHVTLCHGSTKFTSNTAARLKEPWSWHLQLLSERLRFPVAPRNTVTSCSCPWHGINAAKGWGFGHRSCWRDALGKASPGSGVWACA